MKQSVQTRYLSKRVAVAQDITHARTGDIIAIAGLKDVTTGDTLCDEKEPILLERMEFPDPVIKVIAATLHHALHVLAQPTCRTAVAILPVCVP